MKKVIKYDDVTKKTIKQKNPNWSKILKSPIKND